MPTGGRTIETGSLDILERRVGRALYADGNGTLYCSHKYTIYRRDGRDGTWGRIACLPVGFKRRVAGVSRLASRLLRYEIRSMVALPGERLVAANRRSLYFGKVGDALLRPSAIEDDPTPSRPPMWICHGPEDILVWGEYLGNPERRAIRLFASKDGGQSFQVAFVFPAGDVRHIHNIIHDPLLGKYWILTGDFGEEAGFALLGEDFSELEWVARGAQEFRAVCAFDRGDSLVYGTDTEKARNAIMRMDKATGKIERIRELEGSCIYACRFGETYAMSTTVEPSEVNTYSFAQLWLSQDCENWEMALERRRDPWCGKYFQYGSLILPRCAGSPCKDLFFSGQGLRGMDARAYVARRMTNER